MKKKTTIYLDEQDKERLARIREHYHLESDAKAIRFLIARSAQSIKRQHKREDNHEHSNN